MYLENLKKFNKRLKKHLSITSSLVDDYTLYARLYKFGDSNIKVKYKFDKDSIGSLAYKFSEAFSTCSFLRETAEIKKNEQEGNKLGLTVEEKAFYDALTSPEGIRDAYSNEDFIALTKELTEQLRKNRTIDWNRKETARAKMRVMIKRLLKKYKYPPEGQEQALQVVMEQCNKWADDEDNVITMNAEYPPYEETIRMAAEPIG
jgi:type I site-specific restriction-modification system R (restriction) subunit